MEPGLYIGIKPTSAIPENAVHTEYDHSDTHAGRTVNYYRVWVARPERVIPSFKEDETPNRDKINKFTRFLRVWGKIKDV